MIYILLFIGLNQSPSNLGTYYSRESCDDAIRAIYETKLTPRGIELTPQLQESIKFTVDNKIKYQREYTCQRKD
jgi:hypothetical protein